MCREVGKDPQKSFAGRFNVRVPLDLHRRRHGEGSGSDTRSRVRQNEGSLTKTIPSYFGCKTVPPGGDHLLPHQVVISAQRVGNW
ncbi:type II toxin-antitoxin system HicB family antitoxin [Desulfovibrio sp. OttesenSCG-928-F20]|nr:type II toxin-antitoxin system HicB family antitoxin [Desulfovibrio sp. OttesenSCG-928-F20]